MKKIIIPTILAFSVLIAGAFAFVPVDTATTVHDEIIAAITGSQDAVLLDLEDKIKLSSASEGPTAASPGNESLSFVTIRALDFKTPTPFNLKECYLTGTSNNSGGDDIFVIDIDIDGEDLSTGANRAFAEFGPRTDSGAGTTTVELLSGLGFTTGLGAEDNVSMVIKVDSGDIINELTCVAFVQNSADLQIAMSDPLDLD